MGADTDEEGPNTTSLARYDKDLRDLGLLFLHIIADKQMPLSASDFNKKLPNLAKKTGMDEQRLIQLYRFASGESQTMAFRETRGILATIIRGFYRKIDQ